MGFGGCCWGLPSPGLPELLPLHRVPVAGAGSAAELRPLRSRGGLGARWCGSRNSGGLCHRSHTWWRHHHHGGCPGHNGCHLSRGHGQRQLSDRCEQLGQGCSSLGGRGGRCRCHLGSRHGHCCHNLGSGCGSDSLLNRWCKHWHGGYHSCNNRLWQLRSGGHRHGRLGSRPSWLWNWGCGRRNWLGGWRCDWHLDSWCEHRLRSGGWGSGCLGGGLEQRRGGSRRRHCLLECLHCWLLWGLHWRWGRAWRRAWVHCTQRERELIRG